MSLTKVVEKNQNTYFVFNNVFFEIRAFYEKKLKNSVDPERIHMTIMRMRIACWIFKSTNTPS